MRMKQDFTRGAIFGPLMRFVLPVLAAGFLQMLYGAVDLMIVGWYCSPADIAAVSTGSGVMFSLTIVVAGLALGTTVLLGQKFGEGRTEELGPITGSSVCLFGAIGAAIAVLMQPLARFAASALMTPPEAFAQAVTYIRLCSAGAPFIVAYNLLGSVFRGLGNSSLPMLAVAIACAANIAGDWLLIGVCGMGVAGAALATVAAQAVSVALSLLLIRRAGVPFSLTRADLRCQWPIVRRILSIGGPIAFQDAVVNLSFLVIAAIVNSLGVVTAAGIGIAERICGFVMLAPSSYGQAMSTFAAQNIGAGQPRRAQKGLLYAILSSLAAGCVMGWLSFFHGDLLTQLFVQEQPDVTRIGWEYLRAYSIDCLLTSFLFCFIGYFSGLGKTRFVMVQGIVGAFCVRIPVSWLMSRLVPVSVFKIGLATPLSSAVQIALCLAVFAHLSHQEKRA
ncbi:MAG: MATE family efflux transporter [Pyramidobacter sp.]|nr:MATE family efflux transporter [Pyramidobacter sp.]